MVIIGSIHYYSYIFIALLTKTPLNYFFAPINLSIHGKYLRNDIYHTLIYPGWNPNTLTAPKPLNLILSERDNWFWNQNIETNESVRNAQGGIKEIIYKIGAYWMNNPKDITKGIKGCVNTYSIE